MYVRESFTDQERSILNRYFTNTDRPVFAVVNLPEIVKGAMFARYSRTHKSLRRLFLDEYYQKPEIGIEAIAERIAIEHDEHSSHALQRAERLYKRVFDEYGDDSVAQLGGAHLACEQASAILAKVIERGRLAAYLEQSTRYIYYDEKLLDADGTERYRYRVPPEVVGGPLEERYILAMDQLFANYSFIVRALTLYFRHRLIRTSSQKRRGEFNRMTRGLACDIARGLLPAATTSNIGIFATGQAYESMLMRMNASPLAEARDYSKLMLVELRKVIEGFLSRVDVEDRGVAWSEYFRDVARNMNSIANEVPDSDSTKEFDMDRDEVRLVDWDDEAEVRIVAAALYPYSHESEEYLIARATEMSAEERRNVISAYVGERLDRRHKPGRGMERVYYRFDVLSDFGSFRDLQRHRMMTVEWQRLSPRHGYEVPQEIEDAGTELSVRWHDAMKEMSHLYDDVSSIYNADVAQYVVPFGYRIRYNMQLNARQAFHMLELRSGRSGHANYRRISLKMLNLIKTQAGHRAIADAMKFVGPATYQISRFDAEKRQSDKQQLGFDLS